MNDKIKQLLVYSALDETEWGETVELLCALYQRRSYIGEELLTLLAKEIEENLEYAKEHAELTEETETFTRTVKRLEWTE
jgi:hypothetical protein